MKDLNNSFFRFNNMFGFDEFNQDEKQKENNEENKSETKEESSEVKDLNSPAPEISIKQRKIMTDWLDAEYNSAFQYKKVNTVPIKNVYNTNEKSKELDINDPVVIYDFIKKYANFLYDCDCPKEIEKIIIDSLEKEFKEYYKLQSAEELDRHLNTQFIKLKNKYLLKPDNLTTTPNVPVNKITYKTTELIDKLEQQ